MWIRGRPGFPPTPPPSLDTISEQPPLAGRLVHTEGQGGLAGRDGHARP